MARLHQRPALGPADPHDRPQGEAVARRLVRPLLGLALVGALAACGGSGGGAGASESAFERDANDLCDEQVREGTVNVGAADPQSFDEVVVLALDDAEVSAERYEELARLRVPASAEDDFRRIEDLQDERLGVLGDLADAADAGNRRAVDDLFAELSAVEDDLSDEYLNLGLDRCVAAIG